MANTIYMIAGEPSGDQLGATLMDAIRRETSAVSISGIGGEKMAKAGLSSLFDMADIAVMGLAEVIPHIFKITQRINQTVADILDKQPDVLVTIDAPGFCHRVIKKLRARGFASPVVHYVAPTVWAWKPGRAKKLAGLVDHLMVLLPFEPPYFETHGLPTTFVGHPAAVQKQKPAKIRDVICLLPGSRRGEVSRHLDLFGEAARDIHRDQPDYTFVIPTLAYLKETVEAAVQDWDIPVKVVTGEKNKVETFAKADLAIATSGTVSVELAAAQVPQIIAYRMSGWSYPIVRAMVKQSTYASLINILEDKPVVPEYIQNDCQHDRIAAEAGRLLTNEGMRSVQLKECGKALAKLRVNEDFPSQKAASVVLSLLEQRRETKKAARNACQ